MAEGTDRYTATRLSAELGLDNRKMRDILTRVNPVQVKGRSKLYLLRDVIPHAAKYLGAPDVIDLNVERARKVKAEAELAEIELAKEREDLIQVEAVRHVWGELVIATCKYLVEQQINEALEADIHCRVILKPSMVAVPRAQQQRLVFLLLDMASRLAGKGKEGFILEHGTPVIAWVRVAF